MAMDRGEILPAHHILEDSFSSTLLYRPAVLCSGTSDPAGFSPLRATSCSRNCKTSKKLGDLIAVKPASKKLGNMLDQTSLGQLVSDVARGLGDLETIQFAAKLGYERQLKHKLDLIVYRR
jgi:hypothetical protein